MIAASISGKCGVGLAGQIDILRYEKVDLGVYPTFGHYPFQPFDSAAELLAEFP